MRAAALFAGSLVVALALWQLLSTFVFNPFLIPPPLVVLKTAAPMAQSGEIFRKVVEMYLAVGPVVAPRHRTQRRLELANGSRVLCLPGREGTVRAFILL